MIAVTLGARRGVYSVKPMAINVRRFSVELFGKTMLLHGSVLSARRLADQVNESDPYLVMTGIQSYPYMNEAPMGLDQHARGLVNKDMIVMVAEVESAGVEGSVAPEMSVSKVPHRILVYSEHFAISADIHLAEGADLEQFLAVSQGRFVAVTNATVTPTTPGTRLAAFHRSFLLMNRDHIAYLGTMAANQTGSVPMVAENVG